MGAAELIRERQAELWKAIERSKEKDPSPSHGGEWPVRLGLWGIIHGLDEALAMIEADQR